MLILDSTVRQPKQQRLPYHVLILFSSYRLQHLISFQPLQPSEAGMKWDSVCMRMLYYLSFIASLKIMCISAWLTCFNHCHIYSRIGPHTGLILYTFHIPHHKWKGQGQKVHKRGRILQTDVRQESVVKIQQTYLPVNIQADLH